MLVCLSVTLAACSDDSGPTPAEVASSGAGSGDGTSSGGGDGQGSDNEGGEEEAALPKAPELRDCDVSVEVSGDVEASWKGKGDVRIRYDDGEYRSTARYSATDGDNRVTMYTPDQDIPYPAVTFSQGEAGFTSLQNNASKIQVKRSGGGGDAKITLSGLENASVDLQVSFSCANASKQGADKGKNKTKNKQQNASKN